MSYGGGRLFVGGLDDTVTQETLTEEFNKFGPIAKIWVARNPPGFAFVDFEQPADAEAAIEEMNNANGWRVEKAKPRREGGGGRDGGGGRFGGRGGGGGYGDRGGGYGDRGGGYGDRGGGRGGGGGYGGGGYGGGGDGGYDRGYGDRDRGGGGYRDRGAPESGPPRGAPPRDYDDRRDRGGDRDDRRGSPDYK